jgi:hypothetical protein
VPELTRAFLAFIFGICLIVAAAAISPSNNVIIMLPKKQTTLKTLTLSANSFTVGSAPGTFIGNVLNTSPGSTVTFNGLSVANSLQLANVGGIWQVQVGPSAPGAAALITFNLVETLADATSRAMSALTVNENAVSATFDPTNPAASGYALVFDDEFSSPNTVDFNDTRAPGFNWYPGNFNVAPVPASYLDVSGGEFHLLQGNGISLDVTTVAPSGNADGFVGRAFGGGAYFEARVKLNPANVNPGVTNWPSFWADSLELVVNNSRRSAQWPGQVSGYSHFVEDDFFEFDLGTTTAYNGAVHDWYGQPGTCGGGWYCDINNNPNGGNGGTSGFTTGTPSVPPGTDWTQYHTVGSLWVAGTAANGYHGYIQRYFDGVANTDRVTWTGPPNATPPPAGVAQFSVIDQQHMWVALGTGTTNNIGYTIDWVHVWQIPGQGTCIGSGCN